MATKTDLSNPKIDPSKWCSKRLLKEIRTQPRHIGLTLLPLLKGKTIYRLDLTGWKDLRKLPDNLTVEKDLILSSSPIEKLPNNLTVHGNLKITECANLVEFPSDTKVHGDIKIRHCQSLTKMPSPLIVKKSLDLMACKSLKLPDIVEVYGDLNIMKCTQINELGSLIVKGKAVLTANNLRAINDSLTVGISIQIDDESLYKLPKGFMVRHTASLHSDSLEYLPEGFEIGGNLDLRACTNLVTLPKHFHVGKLIIAKATACGGGKREHLSNKLSILFGGQEMKNVQDQDKFKKRW